LPTRGHWHQRAVFHEEPVHSVFNLSGVAQPVAVDLARFQACTPVALVGRVPLPTFAQPSYALALPGHGFCWSRFLPAEAA
jgi:hypothetical protein